MFTESLTWIRTLITGQVVIPGVSVSTKTSARDKEQRLRHRFPCNLDVTCHTVGSAQEEHLPARVRNISLGGINLVVTRRFNPGDLITVDLPIDKDHAPHSLLSCVIHAAPLDKDSWSLGCNFSRELGDEELEAFGARKTRPEQSDQRNWDRYHCKLRAVCTIITDTEPRPVEVEVRNISASGVGLTTAINVPAGALLSVELFKQGATQSTCEVLACVVHTTHHDGKFVLGCNFINELSDKAMKALL